MIKILILITTSLFFSSSVYASSVEWQCAQFLTTEFEDGASYYKGFAEMVLKPLKAKGMSDYASKLEKDVVIDGSRQASSLDCAKIGVVESCFDFQNLELEDGSSYYKAVSQNIVSPLEKIGALELSKFFKISLIANGHLQYSTNLCESIGSTIY